MRQMKRLAVLLVLGPSMAHGWIKYVDEAERFIVNFPSEPEVADMTYVSEYHTELPARLYTSEDVSGRYSVTVVDYTDIEQTLRDRAERTGERFRGDSVQAEVLGSVAFAAWNIRKRGGEITYDAWGAVDRIAGHQLQVTNADMTRSFYGLFVHASRLYILEATVPPGWPPAIQFQQSLGILDGEGRRVRYTIDVDGNRTRMDTSYEWVGSDEPTEGP